MASSAVTNCGTLNYRNIVLKSSTLSGHLNFLHANPGSIKPHLDEIREMISGVDLHLFAVTETWFTDKVNDNLVSLPNYKLIRHDRSGKRGGGVAIYLKSGIKYKILHKSNRKAKVEYLFIEIDNRIGSKLAVGVVYNPPANNRLDSLFRTLEEISSEYADCLIVGDFNINLLLTSSSVNKFKHFLSHLNLYSASNEPTNFVVGKNPSLIDLLLVSDKGKLTRFSQMSLGSFTSHDFIYGSYLIPMEESIQSTLSRYRNFNGVCPAALQKAASSLNWNDIYTLSHIDEKVALVTSLLHLLRNNFAPIIETISYENSNQSWFSPSLIKLINARNYFHNAARHEKNLVIKSIMLKNFRRLRNKVTTLKRNLKSREVCKKLDPSLPPCTLWKNIKNLGITKSNYVSSESFSPDEYNNYFSSIFSEPTSHRVTFDCDNTQADKFEFVGVSDEEIFFALSQIKTNALGIDGIPAIFLKKLCPFIVPFLTHIVNACITQSYFPSAWKTAIIKPIPKVSSPKSVEDFRPISILPCISKILERVLKDQMQSFIDDNKLLCEYQSGFRSGHSTETAMLKVCHDIAQAIENDNVTVLVLLDLKKAFDLVDHEKLLFKIKEKFNFSSRACNLIKSYLSERNQKVCIKDNFSNVVSVSSGTPQGGIMSALLFSLFINDLSEVVETSYHLYADDSQLYCSCPRTDVSQCIIKMNLTLEKLSAWANVNGITINPKKSQAILLCAKTIINAPPIVFENRQIDYCETVISLGVKIDNKFTWSNHVNKICAEANGGLCMLRQSQHLTTLRTRKLLVQALLIPKLTYCSNIFMGCNRASWKQISSVYNSCLRYIFQLRKFDSISQYRDSLLGCEIEKYIYYRSCLFIFKLLRCKSPVYLYENILFPRFVRGRTLSLPSKRKSPQFSKSFFVMGAHLWNSLSSEIRLIESLAVFKTECLSYFTSQNV